MNYELGMVNYKFNPSMDSSAFNSKFSEQTNIK